MRLSSVLSEIIPQAESIARQLSNNSLMLDHAILLLISRRGSHASTILLRLLREWELSQVRVKLERHTVEGGAVKEDRSALLLSSLAVGTNGMLNSGHLLQAVLREREFASSRILMQYGVTAERVGEWLVQLPENEDYYREMQLLNAPAAEGLLGSLSVDLTQLALDGKIDPVVGRDAEISRLESVLVRRRKSNPVLIGEAGVGKSAIVEGLALRLVSSNPPRSLASRRIYSIDTASLVAGTKFRGEFEDRLKRLVEELKADPSIILFIDEIHTIVGAGSTQGALDAANILKPALARGDIQCIGATTFEEYHQFIVADAALDRRFQKIVVEPTTVDQTMEIVTRVAPHYERHHNVRYTESALRGCVMLANRYISDRFFPDKALDLLDEAGSRVSLQDADRVVDLEHIHYTLADMTGICSVSLSQSHSELLESLEYRLESVVIGQKGAVTAISRAVRRSHLGLARVGRPQGVFMFVGPTGVGKTTMAKQLTSLLFAQESSFIRFDMSEYAERHTISRLVGSPPGYVGYKEGGQLTEQVRRHPYSVVLFDEIEKAHSDVCNVMLQIFDEGWLTDGLGRRVDFSNTIIIMTSNAGAMEVSRPSIGFASKSAGRRADSDRQSGYRRALERQFAPEFLNRIDEIVVFGSLSRAEISDVVDIQIANLKGRLQERNFTLAVNECAKDYLIDFGYDVRYGVRSLQRAIECYIEHPLIELMLNGSITDGGVVQALCRDGRIELQVA